MIKKNIILALIALAFLQSCQENKPADTETNVEANLLSPDFDADSAYPLN